MTFHQVLTNDGYVKINFISDDETAMKINEASRDADGSTPPVTSPAFMGGYTYPILMALANGRRFQILKANLPEDGNLKNLRQIHMLTDQPETVYSYVDSSVITIAQIEDYDHCVTPMSSFGFKVWAKPKTFKRLKTANRPFRLWWEFFEPIKVRVVDDDAFTDMMSVDLAKYTPAEVERLLDGAFVINPQLFRNCLENVSFPEVRQDDMRPELMVNYYRSGEYLRQAAKFHAFNGRIVGPMDFTTLPADDPLWTTPGMLKGEAFNDVAGHCENMGVDVICTRSALKFEISNDQRGWVLLEPQKAKRQGVNSDVQTMIGLPALYQFEDVKKWTREYLLAQFERLKNDEIMEEWYDMAGGMFNSSSRFFDENDVVSLTKWNARAWLLAGRRISESPWLFEQMGLAIAKSLKTHNEKKLRFPVPCAVRAQVISQSMASMAGSDLPIEMGTARWSEELEAIVVNDEDWLEMYLSHGGMDLDDFFVGYFRTIDDVRKIVVVRSPNDLGEYSIFNYVEGDWYPEFKAHTGEITAFPTVSGDPALWPTRLSEKVRAGEILYTGLPSTHVKNEIDDVHLYGARDVLALVDNNRGSAACVGANVNARALWSLCVGEHRPVQLTSMENCIDAGTQGGSFDDTEAVMAESKAIIEELTLRMPGIKIDHYMWMSRFWDIYKQPFDRSRFSEDSHVSLANKFRGDAKTSFEKSVRKYAQTLGRNVDPMIHKLGLRLIKIGAETLMATRRQMVRMQSPGEQELIPGDWGDVHSMVLDKIMSYGDEERMPGTTIVDRHDFMMALYSACFKLPTASSQKVTDQLVMNPQIFPYLMEAMRFYGLAMHLKVEDGKLERYYTNAWSLECIECGDAPVVSAPLTLQAYYYYGKTCKKCRQKEAANA